MLLPFYVKNDFMSVKKNASFKTRQLVVKMHSVKQITLCMRHNVVVVGYEMRHNVIVCVRLCTNVCYCQTTKNYLMVTNTSLSCSVMCSQG